MSALQPVLRSNIRARHILDSDLDSVIDLLTRGFKSRGKSHWERSLMRLKAHPTPKWLPKFGCLLESDGVPVGVVLLIYSAIPAVHGCQTRCNISSWYVAPEFRSYASMLVGYAIRERNVIYVNISPAAHTLPIIQAQGFSRYSDGQFVCIPAMSRTSLGATSLVDVDPNECPDHGATENALLLDHKTHGCLSVWCKTADSAHPFVFMPRLARGLPCVQLIYCRHTQEFVRFAGSIGRYLAARGRPLVILDSNNPIPGLFGKYFPNKAPKYYKGPDRPILGDLAYTEAVIFDL